MGSASIEDLIFDLNCSAKSLERDANKCVTEANLAKQKTKQFIKQNRPELAEEEAQLCAVKEEEAVKFEKMSTELETHSGELKLMAKGNKITEDFEKMNVELSKALKKEDVNAAVKLLEEYKGNQDEINVKVDMTENQMQEQMQGIAGVSCKNTVMEQCERELALELQGTGMKVPALNDLEEEINKM